MSQDTMEAGGVGGHIHYHTGISLDDKQKEYWNLYTAENREKYFWLFLNSFVEKWEQKVNIVVTRGRGITKSSYVI